jgi:hypothetical protein
VLDLFNRPQAGVHVWLHVGAERQTRIVFVTDKRGVLPECSEESRVDWRMRALVFQVKAGREDLSTTVQDMVKSRDHSRILVEGATAQLQALQSISSEAARSLCP